jgi:hypothetical protein
VERIHLFTLLRYSVRKRLDGGSEEEWENEIGGKASQDTHEYLVLRRNVW